MKKAIKAKRASKKVISLVAAMTLLTTFGVSSMAASAQMLEKANSGSAGKFYTDYATKDEAMAAAEQLNEDIAAESIVLLKNKDNALPLSAKNYVSVFGTADDALIGGYGSVSEGLKNAGFRVNPTLQGFYAADSYKSSSTSGAGFASGGANIGKESLDFGAKVENSFTLYNDAALIVFSRNGGEGSDPARVTAEVNDDSDNIGGWEHANLANNGKEGAEYKEYKHYLQLTDQENALIDYVTGKFKKVIIVLNTSNAMEMYNLQNDPRISGIVNMGRPGVNGVNALGKVLSGEVNPSAKSVDEWNRDFSADPTWMNFGDNGQVGSTNKYSYLEVRDGTSTGITGVSYEEGIYNGYKYYETVWAEIKAGNVGVLNGKLVAKTETGAQTGESAADAWWNDNVVYPFGYGLSYTEFEMDMGKIYTDSALKTELGATVNPTKLNNRAGQKAEVDKLYVPVTVTNKGNYAGKQVVQLYINAPYTIGGIEKSYVKLVGFAKTDELKPNASQTVVVSFNVQDMASFDYEDLNGNGKTTWELDEGTYNVMLMEDSHNEVAKQTFEISTSAAKAAVLEADDYSLNAVNKTDFSNPNSEYYTIYDPDASYGTKDGFFDGEKMTILSRKNIPGTSPDAHKDTDYIITKEGLDYIASKLNVDADNGIDKAGEKWILTDAQKAEMTDWTQATAKNDKGVVDGTTGANKKETVDGRVNGMCDVLLRDMAGKPFYVTDKTTGETIVNPEWVSFMNQLTFNEIWRTITQCSQSSPAVPSIGKLGARNLDGPNSTGGLSWTAEPNIGATWNTEITHKQGIMVGNLYTLSGYTSWYGPAINSHRSPFAGRNNEYYSSDAIHAGYMAAAAASGCESRGVNCYIKHFTVNDQETNRTNICTFVDEQNLRENYLPAFQMALQEGGASCLMMTFSRVGVVSGPSNYVLLNDITRGEWGWNGVIGTDFFPYRDSAFTTTGLATFNAANSYAVGDRVMSGNTCYEFTAAYTGVQADTFVQANAYKTGDKVIYNGGYYEFTKDQAAGTRWSNNNVKAITVLFTATTETTTQNVKEILAPAAVLAAKAFDATKAYKVGDVVIYNDNYYKFKAAHEAGAWNAEHADAIAATETTYYYSYAGGQSTNVDLMIRNGGVHPLGNDNTCSGQWDATLRGGKGGVTLNTGANGAAEQSDTQYYYMRLQAMRILYCYANSVNIDNGLVFGENYTLRLDYVDNTRNPQAAIKTKSIDGKVGVAISEDLSATAHELGEGNVPTYSIGKGELPKGLTLNATTGALSGYPTEAGKYTFTIFATVAHNHGELDVTLTVADSLLLDGETEITLGEDVDLVVYYDEGAIPADHYTSLTYSANGLPAGVTINNSGEITGTPTVAGEYDVTVSLAAKGAGNNAATDTYQWHFTLKVADNKSYDAQISAINDKIAELTDAIEALEAKLDEAPGTTTPGTEVDLTEVNGKIDAINTTIGTINAAIESIKGDITALKNASGTSGGTVDLTEVNSKIAALETKLAALEGSDALSQLEARVKALEEKPAAEGGCNSSLDAVSMSLVLLPVATLGIAALALKKRKNND